MPTYFLTKDLVCTCPHQGTLQVVPPQPCSLMAGSRFITLAAFRAGKIDGCRNPPSAGGPCLSVARAEDPEGVVLEIEGEQIVTDKVMAITDKGGPLKVRDPGNTHFYLGSALVPKRPTRGPQASAGDGVKKTFVEIVLVDEADEPVAGEVVEIVLPDGRLFRGRTGADGRARVDGVTPGTCKVSFPELDEEAWESA